MRTTFRMSISGKMLAWALAITAIFCSTTAYLVYQIRNESYLTRDIALKRYGIGVSVQQMLERLESVQNNIARFRLLGGDATTAQFIVNDLDRFGEILRGTLARHPEYLEEWGPLTEEYTITLTVEDSPSEAFATDATILRWKAILARSRLENQRIISEGLDRLRKGNIHAYQIGFYGLIGCLLLALPGSALLTWRLSMHLGKIRAGIRSLGSGKDPEPVHVNSGDELEELAEAFNQMTESLRREERMRSDFISMLSHEIRTPLTSIRESVDMMADGLFGEVNEKQERFLRIAEKETDRLAGLLRRLMTVSRLESQSIELHKTPLDCRELVKTAGDRLESSALAKNITLKADLPETDVIIEADQEHMQQVLLNLGGNAVKFSPEGSEVRLTVEQQDNGVVFSVEDQGPGIPESERKLIFQKYYRAEGVRMDKDGAGLGLAIAHAIVREHGGRMWVDCPMGKGCGFRFFLPATQDEDKQVSEKA